MFTDPIFKAAIGVSLLAHLAFVMPYAFLFPRGEDVPQDPANLNYIVIDQALLAEETEVYTDDALSEEEELQVDEPASDEAEFIEPDMAEALEEGIMPSPSQSLEEAKRHDALLKYYNLIREKIRSEIYSGSKKNKTGEVKVTFVLGSDGRLRSIGEVISYTSSHLKKKAIKGIKQAQPFPPFPKIMGARPINFSLTIRFNEK